MTRILSFARVCQSQMGFIVQCGQQSDVFIFRILSVFIGVCNITIHACDAFYVLQTFQLTVVIKVIGE